MIARVLVVLAASVLASVGVWYAFEGIYDRFQYASEEAQGSLEVTEAQTAELQASAAKSDSIVYGVFAAVLVAIAGWFCHPRAVIGGRVKGAVAGLVLGAIAGVAMAQLGHWYDQTVQFPPDPMLYWIGRWVVMLLPVALAAGIAASLSADLTKSISESLVGAVLGAAIAVILYCFLAGSVSPIESHEFIYPANAMNRVMILALAAACIPVMIVVQLARVKQPNEDVPTGADE